MGIEAAALLLVAGAVFAGLAAWDLTPGELNADLPRDLEEKLGDLMVRELRGRSPGVHTEALDKAVAATLNRLVQARAPTAPAPRFGYRCEVLDAPQVNAAMLPGGRIVVFRGLLDVIEQPDELAAVLAHEMGHSEKRHISKRLVRQFGLLVLGRAGGGDTVVIGEIARQLVSLAFDRGQEAEADRFAQELLQRGHIDPRAMATALRHMKEATEKLPESLQMLSTHPGVDERIRDALAHPVPPGTTFQPLDIDWEAVKKSLPSPAPPAPR